MSESRRAVEREMMIAVVFLLVAVGGLFWLAYRRPRPRRWLLPRPAVARTNAQRVGAAVDRQHRHLLAGGLIGEATFAVTRDRFRELLAAGRADEVEAELRPGLDFAVRVKALSEVGTPEAAAVLERQLDRELSPDPVEQAWYWVDVTAGLRQLHHAVALPAVLRCADMAAGLHQGVALAAEAVAFPTFPAVLHDLSSPTGRLAVRALARVARGCRESTADPAAMVRAGLGDHLAAVCETAPPAPDPWLADAVLEAERIARRLCHWSRLIAPDARPLAERQSLRLVAAAGRRAEWLSGVAARLLDRFRAAPSDEQAASLRILSELRADTASLFPELPNRGAAWWADAVRALTWSKSRAVGPALAALAAALVGSRRGGLAVGVPLAALRGHRCREAEGVLMKAVTAPEPAVRRVAFQAIGWWVPYDTNLLVPLLRRGRTDPDQAARRAAVAALARLGERGALLEFAESLSSEEPPIRQLGALTAAEEGLSWLWPDVQDLAESADPDTALAATEALERLREQTLGPLG